MAQVTFLSHPSPNMRVHALEQGHPLRPQRGERAESLPGALLLGASELAAPGSGSCTGGGAPHPWLGCQGQRQLSSSCGIPVWLHCRGGVEQQKFPFTAGENAT